MSLLGRSARRAQVEVLVVTWTLFLDESGNVGPNYLDREQLFHAEGGILVPDEAIPALREIVARGVARLRCSEIKAGRMLDSPRQSGILSVLLDEALQLEGVTVVFSVAERRFALAGRVVETLLDPDTNPAAGLLPAWSVDLREAAWDAVASLNDGVLEQFANAYREPDEATMAAAARALAEAMETQGFSRLGSACRAAVSHLGKIFESEHLWLQQGFDYRQVSSLNVPMCMHATKQADRLLCLMNPPPRFRLIHDHVNWFPDAFKFAASTLSGDTGMPLELPRADGPSVRMGLRQLDSCSVADSRTEVCLQLADLVASSVTKVLMGCATGVPTWTPGLRAVTKRTACRLFDDENLEGTIMASRPMKARIVREFSRMSLWDHGP